MNRKQALNVASKAGYLDMIEMADFLDTVEMSGHWDKYRHYLTDFLRTGKPRFTVFGTGNGKLPFKTWSTLPVVTCPGMGTCGKWCYSFKAWRYPAAFFRQIQNTFLIRYGRDVIISEFQKLPRDIDFRLYVDGDFDSVSTLRFWMLLLARRSDVRTYGYSKSWEIFLEYAECNTFPDNYTLNLSSGGRRQDLYSQMEKLSCTRGDFVAVPISGNFGSNSEKYANPDYHRAVRKSAKDMGLGKVFSCTGQCGDCTNIGHLCGTDNPITIAIGVH